MLREAFIPVFTPSLSSAPVPPKLAVSASGPAKGITQERLDTAAPELAVDLTAIKIEVADDPDEQLPEVVRQYGGMLALLDKEDQTVARYVLEPPSWELQEGFRDVSGGYCFDLIPPRRWAVLRKAAERHDVVLGRFKAYAVFDVSYGRCLKNAIRRQALLDAPGSAGRVSFARVAFAPGNPCGIKVLGTRMREVSLAHKAAR
jgi:hypothetical protein